MNKKIEKCLVEYGLTATDKNTVYGVKNGYEISASGDMYTSLRLHISCYATAIVRSAVEGALANRSDIRGVKRMTEFGLTLALTDLTIGRLVKRLPSILDWVLGMLNANGALGAEYCPHCGKPLNGEGKKCNVSGFYVTMDDDCVAAANTLIDAQNEQFNNKPNRILRGFLGALIGGVAGGLTVALFYLIGFVSALSGIVAVGLGAFLYTKFGGKPNGVMIVIVIATSLVCLVASVVITYIVGAGIIASRAGGTLSAVEAFRILMEIDEEFHNGFYIDLAMVILFAVIGMGAFVWGLWRKVKLNGKQQRITPDQSANAQSPAVQEQPSTDNQDRLEK
ncbi:MAG: hypothetical protein K2M89_07470 [Clostridiales bacterium]|nr:hypothetical protein [Clostridiales bacterium]